MTDLPNPNGLTHLMWFDMETDGLGVVREKWLRTWAASQAWSQP